jgi:hypothetical protein
VEFALYPLLKPLNSSNNRWTNSNIAKFKKELRLALKEQVKLLLASALIFFSPCSVKAL